MTAAPMPSTPFTHIRFIHLHKSNTFELENEDVSAVAMRIQNSSNRLNIFMTNLLCVATGPTVFR